MPSTVYRKSKNRKTNIPAKATGVNFKRGDSLVLRACGGGGLGKPELRNREDIETDLALGFVTRKGIKRDYG
jgi:N-methylhydantoinase B/oxoprolinase/acetone carboxylase alpha subunit